MNIISTVLVTLFTIAADRRARALVAVAIAFAMIAFSHHDAFAGRRAPGG